MLCLSQNGQGCPLQRVSGKDWVQVGCKWQCDDRHSKPQLKRFRQRTKGDEDAGIAELARSKNSRHPLSDISTNKARAERPTKKCRQYLRFIDEEAESDSDEDIDGDDCNEVEIFRIEEEEAMADGFINNSSQLGDTQDELRNSETGAAEGLIHHAVKSEQERSCEFATPLLNCQLRECSQ